MTVTFPDGIIDLGHHRFGRTELDGIPPNTSRNDWSSEPGYEIYPPDGGTGGTGLNIPFPRPRDFCTNTL